MIFVLRIAVFVRWVIVSPAVGESVTLSTETVLWMPFSGIVMVSDVVDVTLNRLRVFCSDFISGAFVMRADPVICAVVLSTKICYPGSNCCVSQRVLSKLRLEHAWPSASLHPFACVGHPSGAGIYCESFATVMVLSYHLL